MTVSWSTFAQLDAPTVKYGLAPNKLDLEAKSNLSSTYTTSRTFNNKVKIQGLKSDTVYYYQVRPALPLSLVR